MVIRREKGHSGSASQNDPRTVEARSVLRAAAVAHCDDAKPIEQFSWWRNLRSAHRAARCPIWTYERRRGHPAARPRNRGLTRLSQAWWTHARAASRLVGLETALGPVICGCRGAGEQQNFHLR